jgi:hypothetical protein
VSAEVVLGRQSSPPHPWNHNRIECGGVFLTQCPVTHPDDTPEVSCARDGYSKSNDARFLFPEMENGRVKHQGMLYAILIHGKSCDRVSEIGFCQIRFPRPGTQSWYPDRIDLLAELAADLRQLPQENIAPVENVGELPEPELREERESE